MTSQARYCHSYANQYINYIGVDREEAERVFDRTSDSAYQKETCELNDIALMQVDLDRKWSHEFGMYDCYIPHLDDADVVGPHEAVTVLKEWKTSARGY